MTFPLVNIHAPWIHHDLNSVKMKLTKRYLFSMSRRTQRKTTIGLTTTLYRGYTSAIRRIPTVRARLTCWKCHGTCKRWRTDFRGMLVRPITRQDVDIHHQLLSPSSPVYFADRVHWSRTALSSSTLKISSSRKCTL